MLFQTYARTKAGIWRRLDPKPVNFADMRASLAEAKESVLNQPFVMGRRLGVEYTHVCAMPVSWSFA